MKKTIRGFTIVELLIVIVVIAILAAITIVAYNGIQQRARDSQRKSDLSNIAKALNLYNVDHGDYVETSSGCGANGDGQAWMNYSNGSSYPNSITGCLINGKYLSRELNDPKSSTLKYCASGAPDSCFDYMKYSCANGTWLYAHLESIPQSSTATDSTCQPSIDTGFGMNYVVRVE